jgi:hypothetical protein
MFEIKPQPGGQGQLCISYIPKIISTVKYQPLLEEFGSKSAIIMGEE